ncbi:NLI interacting factor-like phosphatase family protein [Babesia bovis T2Bo]|uniref:protein-serine/threonine phosphatase n=1 Tax=Babesia bovis TaxID=5865 RepID=A7AM05_BABBO|nr:NLI interacting factor-like phosphatase family protein [Babesia bovis T2Bo]EDO07589.1 NLI interacting factor-like phosphatase family protein [Babesia bovis T2Bo]|eukprot:XP_001611157.1 protein phosphatase family protein [Babesia bovis T2Bo]
MDTDEPNIVDELEQWLESELLEDDGSVTVPSYIQVPFKIHWIASDGSNVVANQILATLSSTQLHETADAQLSTSVDCETTNTETIIGSDVTIENLNTSDETSVESSDSDTKIDDAHFTLPSKDVSGVSSLKYQDSISPSDRPSRKPSLLYSSRHGILRHQVPTDTIIADASTILAIVESIRCSHSVIIHGMCVNCCEVIEDGDGKRPTEAQEELSKRRASKNHLVDANMVIPGFITNDNAVRLDPKICTEMELLELLRLLKKRKLCLVLDLDNTLIHSSCSKVPDDIDIPVIDMYSNSEGWKITYHNEEDNLMYESKLESSVLMTRTLNEMDGSLFVNYYKLRPGVYDFLRRSAELYELYLFTMGTRAHANAALKILDPDGKYFGARVFSRSETNNCFKSLCRIFPKYRNHLLILDDSENIWLDAPGLIKVYPYYFFTDMSVIKNRDARNLGRVAAALQAHCNYSNYIWHSVIMEIWNENEIAVTPLRDKEGFTVPMTLSIPGKQIPTFKYNHLLIANERPKDIFIVDEANASCPKEVNHSNESTKDHQTVTDKDQDVSDKLTAGSPLLGGSMALKTPGITTDLQTTSSGEKVVEAPKKEKVDSSEETKKSDILPSGTIPNKFARQIGKIYVKDNDAQLVYMTRLLCEMHQQFFNELDTAVLDISKLKSLIDAQLLPDVGTLLGRHREKLLRGVVLHVNRDEFRCLKTREAVDFFAKTDLGNTCRRFGVKKPTSERTVTHYLTNNGTSIVLGENTKKVHSQWIEACIYTWTFVPESGFDPSSWKEPFRNFWDALQAQQLNNVKKPY